MANIPRLPRTHLLKKKKNKKRLCVCVSVWFYVCGQLQSREFALQSVNMPDNTTVAGRLIRIQLLISAYILITHQPYFIQNHLLIPSISENKTNEITDNLVTYGKYNEKFFVSKHIDPG